jgi:hypothetical protein
MDNLGNQVAQQSSQLLTNELNKKEKTEEARFQATQRLATQEGVKQVNKVVAPAKATFMQKLVSKMPQGLKNGISKLYELHSKTMGGIGKALNKTNTKIGKFLAKPFVKSSEVSMKASNFFAGKNVASSLASKAATKVATKAATKGVATALAAPTAGMSVVAEQAASTAQTVGGVASKAGKAKAVADVVKPEEAPAKDAMADKANHIVQGQATKIMSTVAPGIDKMQGLALKANEKKDDKNKDTSVAIFSGTKDMMGKVGITKDFGLGK